jgi:hypothetical protein
MTKRLVPGTDAVRLESDGKLRVGAASDYAQFDSDGILTLTGTARVWKAMELDPNNVVKPQADYPGITYYQDIGFDAYDDGNEEQVFFIWHIPPDIVIGTASVRGHFGGMVSNEAGDEYVAMGFEWWKFSDGDTFDVSGAADGGGAVNLTIVNGEGNYVWHESDTGTVDTTGWAIGDIVVFRFFRDVDDVYTGGNPPFADNYTGDALIGMYHLEYLSDKLGEAS